MDGEQVDRERRGRRIFEALRRGRGDDDASESAPSTAVEEPPDDREDAEPSRSEAQDPASQPASLDPVPADEDQHEHEAPPETPPPSRVPDPEAAPEAAVETSDSDAGGNGHVDAEPNPPPAAPPSGRGAGPEQVGSPEESGPLPGLDALAEQLDPAPPQPGPPVASPSEASPAATTPAHDTATGTIDRGEPVTEEEADAASLPRVIAIANQKGGVGKTTTAVNLSAALTELGFRVLVVDLDPQGNATTGLGIDIRNLETTVYDSLMSDVPLEDCVEPTSVRNLFVAPSNMDLAGAEIELVPMFSRELKLRRAVEAVKHDYDYVLIDCPPSLGLLTINGLAAADDVVVPIQCEYYALEGLGQLVNNVNLVRTNLNPVLDVRGIVLTMYDARTKLADQVVQEVRAHFGSRVYETVVPRTVRLSEAPSFGQPIIVFDSASRGSDAYRALAKEVSRGARRRQE